MSCDPNKKILISLVDIERTYGQRKLLAQRIPIMPRSRKSESRSESSRGRSDSSLELPDPAELSTPAVTEGETATDSELETETENEITPPSTFSTLPVQPKSLTPRASIIGTSRRSRTPSPIYPSQVSQHDLMNSYFRKDALLLSNIDLLR